MTGALQVTMVTGSLSRRAGGLFDSVRSLSRALNRQGFSVEVIGLRDADTERDLEAWAPIRPIVVEAVGPAVLAHVPGLAARLEGADIVHQHGIWQLWSRTVADFARRAPTMISPHGMLDPWALANSGWKKRLAWIGWERQNLSSAARLHALAEAEATAIRAVLPGAPVAVIPNGVSLENAPMARQSNAELRTCLFLARIHPKKGLRRLFDQWAALPEALRARWRLDVAGPDEVGERAVLETHARELGLADEVRFLGPLHGLEKVTAFARANAFVLPSYSEGLPMAVLEAWAAGLPVLMTHACNLPEGFAEGAAHEIGDDPEALAAGLARVDLEEMGARGRALVADRFTWERIAARHAELYAEMAGRASPMKVRAHV